MSFWDAASKDDRIVSSDYKGYDILSIKDTLGTSPPERAAEDTARNEFLRMVGRAEAKRAGRRY